MGSPVAFRTDLHLVDVHPRLHPEATVAHVPVHDCGHTIVLLVVLVNGDVGLEAWFHPLKRVDIVENLLSIGWWVVTGYPLDSRLKTRAALVALS